MLPSSKTRSLKNPSRLRLEGPRAALSNQWMGERVRVGVGVGGWRPGNPGTMLQVDLTCGGR